MKYAVFDTTEIFNYVKNQGALPSGVNLGVPLMDMQGRCACSHEFDETDVLYLEGFEGVDVLEQLPLYWEYPPEEF